MKIGISEIQMTDAWATEHIANGIQAMFLGYT